MIERVITDLHLQAHLLTVWITTASLASPFSTMRSNRRVAEAQQLLEREQAVYHEFAKTQPAESLRADLEALTFSGEGPERDLTDLRAQAAELSTTASDSRIAGLRARIQSLEMQDAEMGRQIQAKAALSSERDARADELSQRLKTAQTALDTAAEESCSGHLTSAHSRSSGGHVTHGDGDPMPDGQD